MLPVLQIISRRCLLAFLALFSLLSAGVFARAQEPEKQTPGAPHLLPIDTLVYARISRVNDLREEWPQTSMGKLMSDPSVRPFAGDLYLTMQELFQAVGENLEITLNELLAIPQGQVAIALMPRSLSPQQRDAIAKEEQGKDESPEAITKRLKRKRQNQKAMAVWIMIEAGDKIDSLMGLIEKLETQASLGGYVRRESQINHRSLIRWLPPRPGRPEMEYFVRDQTLVIGIGHNTAAQSLKWWDDPNEGETLAKKADFAAIMSRCLGAEETRPQITFFVDPYHLIKRLAGPGIFLATLENAGLKKIRGIGGSVFHGGETFEAISHLHVLIDTPRDGIFGVLRPGKGASMPPAWVPQEVTTYSSVHWNFEKAYLNLGKLLEKFSGSNVLENSFEIPIRKTTDIDVRKEISETLTGRYITCQWIEPPIRLNSLARLHAMEVTDPDHVRDLFAKLRKRYPNKVEVDSFGGSVLYRLPSPKKIPESFRKPEPSFVVLGNWVLFSDSPKLIENVLKAEQNSMPRLANDLDFELVFSELGGKLDGEKPFMVSFARGADLIEYLYDLVRSDEIRRFLKKQGENNPTVLKLHEFLSRSDLTQFKRFREFFAPSGTFGYNESTGIHFGSFTLRSQREDAELSGP